jgi:hypothetical protein
MPRNTKNNVSYKVFTIAPSSSSSNQRNSPTSKRYNPHDANTFYGLSSGGYAHIGTGMPTISTNILNNGRSCDTRINCEPGSVPVGFFSIRGSAGGSFRI